MCKRTSDWMWLLVVGAGLGAPVSHTAWAQAFPARPVRVIVPFSSGSASDVLVRLVTPKLQELTGQPFVVDNRPGAGGRTGMEAGAKAAPDGYTLTKTAVGPLVHAPILYPKTAYDPVRDFTAISFLATGPLVIVAHPSLPAKNMKDLITLARQHPGQLNYGSTGVGSVNHLLGEMVQMYANVRLTHVPYKGGGDAIAALLTGDVALVMTGVPAVMPLVRTGRVRTIVSTGAQRTAELPDVQTVAEAGLKNAEFLIWYGLVAPAATPKNIVEKLNREVVKAMAVPAVAERFRQQGVNPQTTTPEQFAQVIRDDFARWTRIIRAAKIRLE